MDSKPIVSEDGLIFRCPMWDCGWCMADMDKGTSDSNGECNNPQECKYRQKLYMEMINKANNK